MTAKFDDVTRAVFDAVSDRPHDNATVTIYYNGTNFRGSLTIDTRTSIDMKKALTIFLEEFSR